MVCAPHCHFERSREIFSDYVAQIFRDLKGSAFLGATIGANLLYSCANSNRRGESVRKLSALAEGNPPCAVK